MENLNNSKTEQEIIKDKSDEQIARMCKTMLLEAYEVGDGAPNPHSLESAYQLKRELEKRKVDVSILEELKELEEDLRKEYGM